MKKSAFSTFDAFIARAPFDRRSGHDRRELSPEETVALDLCRKCGVTFIGIQQGFAHVPAQLLFQQSARSTTLAVKAEGATTDAIEERLRGNRIMQRVFFEAWYPAAPSAGAGATNPKIKTA